MSTNIIISDIAIHRDAQERYSLNDLHQASSGEEKDKPANCLRSDKTIELIDEILKAQI
nr:KilA-N domain-containing protein [Candidatus Symbiopectobacterium sp.]